MKRKTRNKNQKSKKKHTIFEALHSPTNVLQTYQPCYVVHDTHHPHVLLARHGQAGTSDMKNKNNAEAQRGREGGVRGVEKIHTEKISFMTPSWSVLGHA